ncbi:hypothetical protein J4471_04980 [Candidatus Woesearchaeota archaeon]|nr:hypothetical protein [Candidatus Woesearchaeota archaeon]
MDFLIRPGHHRPWVATNRELSRKELSDLVLGSDAVIADLDDCILPSPAKRLVYERLRDIKSYFDYDFILWSLESGLSLIKDGKSAESDCWKEYIDLFLYTRERKIEAKEKIERLLREGKLKEYPGASDFFNLVLKSSDSHLLTRNIPEITEIFREKYGFSYAFSQTWNKVALVVPSLFTNRQEKYLIIGDSKEDQRLVDKLKPCEGTIGSGKVTSIYVAESPNERHLNEHFTINIGRDYRGLVDILRNSHR